MNAPAIERQEQRQTLLQAGLDLIAQGFTVFDADLRLVAWNRAFMRLLDFPEIAIPVSKLTELPFSPHEGFVLSRINGVWDVKSIMKISPIKELEVLMIFQSLAKSEVIRWKKK